MSIFDFLGTMKGPEFVALYVVWFLLLFGAVLLLRRWGFDTRVTTLTGFVLFEGLGVARYLIGSANGMQNWGFMAPMMIVGGVMFFTRGSSSNGGALSSDSGGGCGSDGGCGGGGCGGCG
ncbi:MAG TPA: hypothetical protein VIS96_00895 [Terrimicrobiaceae bacterium]